MGKALKRGDKLPAFSLQDQEGKVLNSKDWFGAPVVIYFYPSDNTVICTAQACTFRDYYSDFKDLNVRVIGISNNTVKSHEAFAKRYQLPFTLLADIGDTVRTLFGVPKGVFGILPGRVTYIFDADGTLVDWYDSDVRVKGHIKKALKALSL